MAAARVLLGRLTNSICMLCLFWKISSPFNLKANETEFKECVFNLRFEATNFRSGLNYGSTGNINGLILT